MNCEAHSDLRHSVTATVSTVLHLVSSFITSYCFCDRSRSRIEDWRFVSGLFHLLLPAGCLSFWPSIKPNFPYTLPYLNMPVARCCKIRNPYFSVQFRSIEAVKMIGTSFILVFARRTVINFMIPIYICHLCFVIGIWPTATAFLKMFLFIVRYSFSYVSVLSQWSLRRGLCSNAWIVKLFYSIE